MGSIIYLILVGVLYTSGVVTEVQAAILFVVIMVLKISIKVSYICEVLTEISNNLSVIDSRISLTVVETDWQGKEYFVNKYLNITPVLSEPLGGDQMIGAMIAQGQVDVLIFFCDNLITQGHQVDISALSRLASLYNIAFATNRTTADMILTSTLFNNKEYKRIKPDFTKYLTREVCQYKGAPSKR